MITQHTIAHFASLILFTLTYARLPSVCHCIQQQRFPLTQSFYYYNEITGAGQFGIGRCSLFDQQDE